MRIGLLQFNKLQLIFLGRDAGSILDKLPAYLEANTDKHTLAHFHKFKIPNACFWTQKISWSPGDFNQEPKDYN